ncbi:hypothetical protein A3B60_04245 [Candidatus Peregrinibacteria bacterium RIFCSPLOWO2_01_FULL_39_12]|nr:MAG: hypothetical protein A3B60_04245 [Candidatus Peregrinibacteria bacterium RIFCSPLOWO2_01_FULL_39_12]
MLKVDDKIKQELDLIRSEEGLGTQTATITYLVKYYFLTKKSSLDTTIAILDKALEKLDTSKIPSIEEQLKDL